MDRQILLGGSVHADMFEPGDWRIGDRRLGEELTPVLAEILSDVPEDEEVKLTVSINAQVDGAEFQPTYVGSVPGWVERDDDPVIDERKGIVEVFRGGVEFNEIDSLLTVGHVEVVRRVAQLVSDLVGELDEQAATVNLEITLNLIRLADQLGNDIEGDALFVPDTLGTRVASGEGHTDRAVATEGVHILVVPAGEEVPV